MKTLINMTVFDHDMDRFTDKEDLHQFYSRRCLDGLELQVLWNHPLPYKIITEDVVGVHLRMFPSWLDFWFQDKPALMREFGAPENWEMYYEGADPSCILRRLKAELKIAESLGAAYVVFHVSDCRFSEVYSGKHHYKDEEVIDASCGLINQIFDDEDYSFQLLVENLWWPGFTFTNPELTKRLMDGIHTDKKGIMLDTGHLLHTNLALRTEKEGLNYINQMLDDHGDLCRYIYGIHLNQSLTGEYVETVRCNPPILKDDFWERFWQCSEHIFNIDAHLPFTYSGVNDLIHRVSPTFLTLEIISSDRETHGANLDQQLMVLKGLK
ncbi:MAG: TIM barrel protein [Eubacterium sp.]